MRVLLRNQYTRCKTLSSIELDISELESWYLLINYQKLSVNSKRINDFCQMGNIWTAITDNSFVQVKLVKSPLPSTVSLLHYFMFESDPCLIYINFNSNKLRKFQLKIEYLFYFIFNLFEYLIIGKYKLEL